MPAIPFIAAAAIGFGASAILGGAFGGAPDAPNIPALPNADKAKTDAGEAQKQQRRTALASGGLTDQTGGSGIILDKDVKNVSLVGG